MFRLIRIELKRLFSNKLSLMVPIITSVITLFLLASLIAPAFFSNKRFSTLRVALYLEDDSPDINLIVRSILGSKSFNELFALDFVKSIDEGQAAIEAGEVAFMVYVPADTTSKLLYREKVTFEVWINPDYAMETGFFLPVAEQMVMGFNNIQNTIDVVYMDIANKFDFNVASDHYYSVLLEVLARLLDRQSYFRFEGISPLGRYLPYEYYSAAVFTFFAALGMVPVSGFYARDFEGHVLSRGVLGGRHRRSYLLARVLAGTAYILVICLPMLIIGILLSGSNIFLTGNVFALVFALILIALCFASLAVLIALIFPKGDSALWVTFFFTLIAAFLGGIFLPEAVMPPALAQMGKFLPLRASLNAFAACLYNARIEYIRTPLLSLLLWVIGAGLLSLPLFERRLRE